MTNTNRLIHESSPYLQQHAHNPVDWYPWGEEALERARKENKPILLSIGYAACHWCHVMAHDTFEDIATAETMNSLFINIKVDREERPDLDKVYQTTHYLLTQQGGGWPLTVFLTPTDLMPFFSGTYFPAKARDQLPAFTDILKQLSEIYHHRQADIQQQNAELAKILNPPAPVISDLRLNKQPIQHALQVLQRNYDTVNGGFGQAPKFPQPSKLAFLLQEQSPLAATSLQHMAAGGIYDQLGGGFFRYSVDAKWRIPHFEKMLYDNAQLLYLYSQVFKIYPDMNLDEIIRDSAQWVMTKMQAPEGGYYSSIDADSEKQEGKFYVWDINEVKNLLSAEEFSIVESHYGLNHPANFEGHWHFYIAEPLEVLGPEKNDLLQSAKKKLFAAREKRIAPGIDTKILTGWNALMIKAMLTAGYLCNESAWIDSANRALNYIEENLWKNQRLLATNSATHSRMAYLDDYAFLIDALLTAYQYSHDKKQLDFAIELADNMIKHFEDQQAGGFFFTADDHETLIYRPKSFMDEAIPSGNAIAAKVLLMLGQLTADSRYTKSAEKTVKAGWPLLTQYPAEHAELLMSLGSVS